MSTIKNFYKTVFETQENKWKTGLFGMIIITSMLAGVFYYEANAINVENLADLEEMAAQAGAKTPLIEFLLKDKTDGYTEENSIYEVNFDIPEDYSKLVWVNCTLTWTDEASIFMQGTNDPDEFKVTIIAPNKKEVESDFSFNSQSGAGLVGASFKLDYEEDGFRDNFLGTWTIEVEAGECGNDAAFIPLLGRREENDYGNDWSLSYVYTYLDKEKA